MDTIYIGSKSVKGGQRCKEDISIDRTSTYRGHHYMDAISIGRTSV